MKIPSLLALAAASLFLLLPYDSRGQILMSGGTYSQNFDSLASTGTNNTWTDNITLPGWYASKTLPLGATNVTVYRAGTGSDTAGALYSFGTNNAPTDRALGSLGSGTPGNFAFGVRFTNDTASPQSCTISYTGEEWREGGNTNTQKLEFSYQVGNQLSASDAVNSQSWTAFPALDFVSPVVAASAAVLDGNLPANQVTLTSIPLSGVVVLPGNEIFIRWFDLNDSGSDHGLGIDNLTVSFTATNSVPVAPLITTHPTNQTVVQGNTATFSIQATGTAPLSYQWYFNDINTPVGNAASSLTISFVNTNQAGNYFAIVNNSAGSATSQVATLTVTLPPAPITTNIAYLRTLVDATNYAPTDTTTLYTVEGIVTTYTNVTSPTNTQFFIQDSNAAIVVFEAGGTIRPAAGDLVRVTGPIGSFNGELELNLHIANANHSIVVLSSANVLPDAIPFDLATQTNVALMESAIEGKRVIISNVFLQNAGDPSGFVVPSNVNLTNLDGKVMVFRVDQRVIELAAQTIPEVATLTGVIGQFDSAAPFTNGYQLFVTRLADVVPTVPQVPVKITKTPTDTVVSWSAVPTGFSLESTPSLSPTNWQPVAQTAIVTNSQNVITVAPGTSEFFRSVGRR